ncbi:hypothetical protein [Anaerotignum sp.]|uniref:hypothetical protein n=1 Tax=Anaerotignum sp. TaxID=2039241 RepID=UPI002715391B|nr:hypothetical protein [Anaerotignum sp.]
MNKTITIKKKILFCLYLFIIFYCLFSVFISLRIDNLIRIGNEMPDKINPKPEMISDEDFQELCYKYKYAINKYTYPEAWEISFRTPVLTFHWFTGAKSVYWYFYDVSFDGNSNGSWGADVQVTSEFKNGSWIISDVYEGQ